MTTLPPISQVDFGDVAAENESTRNPDLLTRGYFAPFPDRRLIEGPRWLVVGRKGTGKSAIGEHLRLSQGSTGNVVRVVHLDELNPLTFAPSGAPEHDGWWQSTLWQYLVWLQVMAAFSRNQRLLSGGPPELRASISTLQRYGLLATDTFGEVVANIQTAVEAGVNIAALRGGTSKTATKSSIDSVPVANEVLSTVAATVQDDAKHVVILDGLDDVLMAERDQWRMLGSLLKACDRVMQRASHGSAFKLLVLCRDDLLSRVPGANRNKRLQDATIHLKWHQEAAATEDYKLFDLVTHKARVSLPSLTDPFTELLPAAVSVGGPLSKELPTRRYLVDRTRLTPRDLLRLLHFIGEVAEENRALNNDTLRSGVRRYAERYFVAEMRDQVYGLLEEDLAGRCMDLMSTLGRSKFGYGELQNKAKVRAGVDGDAFHRAMEILYEAGAIAHTIPGTRFTNFSYRTGTALRRDGDLMLHAALIDAWNIRRSRQGAL